MNGNPSIILITIDSLRFDHLGCYGYSKDTTPNIDKLAKGGILFTQAISNGGNTPFSFPAILASALSPLSAEESRMIMRRCTTIAEVLRNAGYQTAAFHSNPYLSELYGYNRGFDIFEGNLKFGNLESIRQWLISKPPPKLIYGFLARVDKLLSSFRERPITSAPKISRQAISWLKNCNRNFFLWMHYMNTHNPYMPLPEYVRRFHGQDVSRFEMNRLWQRMLSRPPHLSPDEVETLKDLYDAEIRHVDDAVGWLLKEAKSHLKNTVIVVTADHGEEFGEHGMFSHQSLYDGVLRVPLVIAGTGVGGVVGEQVGLVDLAPTVAELAGLGKTDSFYGESLLPLMMRRGGVAKGVVSVWCNPQPPQRLISYRTPKWKYIRTEDMDGGVLREEVYSLFADSRESANLFGKGELLHQIMDRELCGEVAGFRAEASRVIDKLKRDKVEELTNFEKVRVRERIRQLKRRKG